jgi:hypothetical protein
MTEEDILALCPALADDPNFRITSPPNPANNCFGWTAGDENRRWDATPTMAPTRAGLYWPPGIPLLNTISAYMAAYETIGYAECEGPEPEEGMEKIALYVNPHEEPGHAARQLPSGTWTSRLGAANDIEHGAPEGVENLMFGRAVRFMKRPRA